MTPNKKKVMLPHTLAKAGWDVVAPRDDIDAVGYDPYLSMPDLQAALKDTDGIALSLTPLKGPEIAVAPRLRVAARIGVGYDAVDIPALTARKIPLMVVGTANSVTVAEHAVFMMYGLAKKAFFHDAAVRENRWQDRWKDVPIDLAGKTILIVGFGRIGTRTAKRCLAMEMTVLIYDPYVPAADIKAAGCEPVADLDAALPRVDLVCIHCPKTPETVGMFNAARFAEDEAVGVHHQHGARRHHRRKGAACGRSPPASSRVPASTCSTRSRRPPTIRCSSCRTRSSPRTWRASRSSRWTAWRSPP